MTKVDLNFVNAQKGRDGRVRYWYFRRDGRRWRLPGVPQSPEFMAEYQRLLAATVPKPAAEQPGNLPGSFGALVSDYLASGEFRELKPNSQRLYRLILEPLAERHGTKPLGQLQRRHIKAWRDARSETPGMANMVVKVVRALLIYAVDNNYRLATDDNPLTVRTKLFKGGEHRAWTEEECAGFEARWPPGTMQRRAYMLAKCTGQRCGDIAAMTRAHRKDGFIRVVQQKTGKELWIPELQLLTAELARGEAGHMSLLTKADGGAFDGESLSPWFADAIDAAGLTDDCVLHGLRKTAAKMFAEADCSPHLIGSITGHDPTSPEIVRYTRAADQRKMSTAAVHRLEQNAKGTLSGKRPSSTSGKQSQGIENVLQFGPTPLTIC
jgi:enterobacteria phage integrase